MSAPAASLRDAIKPETARTWRARGQVGTETIAGSRHDPATRTSVHLYNLTIDEPE